jgi:hypothetical protein
MPNSSERRVTVNGSVYPKLRAWAERDGLTVADVVNAILLQTVCPYGATPSQVITPAVAAPMQPSFSSSCQIAAAVNGC